MEITLTDKIEKTDEEAVVNGLVSYNLARIENTDPRDLGVFLRDDEGKTVAGLLGETHGLWLTVKLLWVEEKLRGKHIGGEILARAEAEAAGRGCKHAFLDTFDFQAPEFYKKHGYKEVFALTEYPVSGARRFFTKEI